MALGCKICKQIHCDYCRTTAKTTEIPLKECSAYGQIDQGGGEYGGREGPFHSGNLRVSNLDNFNLSISNLVRERSLTSPTTEYEEIAHTHCGTECSY